MTATAPYAILTLLLIRGAMLPGAYDGVMYFVKPSISALNNMQALVHKFRIKKKPMWLLEKR